MSNLIGKKALNFTLQDTKGEKVSLYDFKNKQKVVLLFFPLAFSSVCTDEMCSIRDNMKLYNSLDAKVIGISVDSFYTLEKFKKTQNLKFTLLSDFNKTVSKKYDALYDDFYGMQGVSKRAAFVIDQKGIVRYEAVLDDAGNLPDFDAIESALVSA